MAERLFEDLNNLLKMIEEEPKPSSPPPAALEAPQPQDLESAAKRLKDQLAAIQEIVTTAEKTAPLKRFIWLAWGAVQSLASDIDGIEEELRKKGKEIGKDTTAAVKVIADLKKLMEPLTDAIDSLNTISKG
jgi:hypothetical protein